jgi:hypothetical protein
MLFRAVIGATLATPSSDREEGCINVVLCSSLSTHKHNYLTTTTTTQTSASALTGVHNDHSNGHVNHMGV